MSYFTSGAGLRREVNENLRLVVESWVVEIGTKRVENNAVESRWYFD